MINNDSTCEQCEYFEQEFEEGLHKVRYSNNDKCTALEGDQSMDRTGPNERWEKCPLLIKDIG